jgi:hypothetical protein
MALRLRRVRDVTLRCINCQSRGVVLCRTSHAAVRKRKGTQLQHSVVPPRLRHCMRQPQIQHPIFVWPVSTIGSDPLTAPDRATAMFVPPNSPTAPATFPFLIFSMVYEVREKHRLCLSAHVFGDLAGILCHHVVVNRGTETRGIASRNSARIINRSPSRYRATRSPAVPYE